MLHITYMLRSYTNPQWQGAPAPVEDYQAFGFHLPGAQVWRRHWIPAQMADRSAVHTWGVWMAKVRRVRLAAE